MSWNCLFGSVAVQPSCLSVWVLLLLLLQLQHVHYGKQFFLLLLFHLVFPCFGVDCRRVLFLYCNSVQRKRKKYFCVCFFFQLNSMSVHFIVGIEHANLVFRLRLMSHTKTHTRECARATELVHTRKERFTVQTSKPFPMSGIHCTLGLGDCQSNPHHSPCVCICDRIKRRRRRRWRREEKTANVESPCDF